MREIKFRAWNKGNRTMIDLYKITPLALSVQNDGLFLPFNSNLELMQYTGLKDKNGKEVFEGDIFQCQSGSNRKNCLHAVVWQEARAFGNMGQWNATHLREGGYYDWIGKEEIVGNIYENPDLLP